MNPPTKSTLNRLRSLSPRARLTRADARVLAEHQANALIEAIGSSDGIHERHLSMLPRIRIEYDELPTSGLSYWNGIEWMLVINKDESPARQRFSMLHEYKHVIDHVDRVVLYASEEDAERAADYFAGCVLMPKREMKRLFCGGLQRPEDLAEHFGTSAAAVRVRLDQIGLIDPTTFTRNQRCARPVQTPPWRSQRFRPVKRSFS